MFDPSEPLGAIDDEPLRRIFSCCHPALAVETRVPLTLRVVGGLTVAKVARVLLVQETADHPPEGQDQGGPPPFRVPLRRICSGPMRSLSRQRGPISTAYSLPPSAH